jgi:hypothetical protein
VRIGAADFVSDGASLIITIRCNIYLRLQFSSLVSVLDNIAELFDSEKGLKPLVPEDVSDCYFTV